MDLELENKLKDTFPVMFEEMHGDKATTCMHFGCECHNGWYNIINQLCMSIDSYINTASKDRQRELARNILVNEKRWDELPKWDRLPGEHPVVRPVTDAVDPVVFKQIKEKFGTLTIYFTGGDAVVSNLIHLADLISSVTCENCGSPGVQRTGGWIRVQCDGCYGSDNTAN